jgi:hypothetical protein
VLDEVFVERAGRKLVAVLVHEEQEKLVGKLSSVIERDEEVVEAREKRLPRDRDRWLALFRDPLSRR